MSKATVYFVGQHSEVAHHAAPFADRLNIQIAEPANVLSNAQPGDLAIFYSEHFERFRETCKQLNSKNVATLYMIDGILEWRNAWENRPDEVACPYTMRPVLAHKVACIGHSQARVLDSWGNAEKTEIVGIPRLDRSLNNSNKTNSNKSVSQKDSSPFRVLVMTAKTPGFTPEQIQRVEQSLNDLKQWHANNPTIGDRKVEFTWRLTGDLSERIGVENKLSDLSGGELNETLASVDAVITTPSTAILEALLLDLPVAVLDYHNCPHYVTGGWDICSKEHIAPTIAQMEQRLETRMLFQANELGDALQCFESSTDRFVELVESMMKIASEKIAAGESLSFPTHILKAPKIKHAQFSHKRLYVGTPEFACDDKTELQLELSHARREISHLQKELAQAHSELNQAHQIFEQIEKHPIAGPVVRIRQKMLDLMAAMRKRKSDFGSSSTTTNSNHSSSAPKTGSN